MVDSNNTDKRWLYLLFLYLLLLYVPYVASQKASGNNFIKGDCYYYRAVIDSILQDGDLLMTNNIKHELLNGQLALGTRGLVPKHPILMPLISLPFYYLLGNTGLLLFNILICFILHAYIFKLNSVFFDPLISFMSTVLYASATLFLDYAYNYSSDILSTALVLGGLYFVFIKKCYVGSFMLGLSVFAKVTNIPIVAVIMLYNVLTISSIPFNYTKSKTVIIAILIFLSGIVPFAYTNYVLFDSPFVTGYQRTATAGSSNNQIVISNHTNKFNRSLLTNSINLLFHPEKGIIPTNPVVLLAFVGAIPFIKRDIDHKILLILVVCFIQFIIFAKYDEWHTSHFSNRFLMTTIALSSVFTSSYIRILITKLKLYPEN